MEFEAFVVEPCDNGIYIRTTTESYKDFGAKTSEEAVEIIRTLLPEDSAKSTCEEDISEITGGSKKCQDGLK